MQSRIIAHMDMDAFFAAVEQRDNPSLKGKPVIIGADPQGGKGRGVVSTCSYEARKFKIHSAMPISIAYQRCPHGIFLRGNHQKYSRVSKEIFKILYDFTPDVQPISIDEAFMDLTGCVHFYGSAINTGKKIKARISKEIGLNASIGIAPNKMVAKIGSAYCKPNGLLEIKEEDLLTFLWALPVEKIWGVGEHTQSALKEMNIVKVGDLAKTPVNMLIKKFGIHGEHLHQLANGIDEREVIIDEEIKSVSHEHTFDEDTSDKEEVLNQMLYLCEKTSRRLRKYDLKGKTVSVKIRLKGFQTYTRAQTMGQRINFSDIIYQTALELFNAFYKPGMYIRLIGVRVSNFDDQYVQDSLFEDPKIQKDEDLHKAFDQIKDKFGEKAIRRGIYKNYK
ncbi:MAG: DNA polymerase IV [Candidatus Omnitrophica bacterium]|nr:DNA polymerase IV [Candidatus Omnitrophota bacterium]